MPVVELATSRSWIQRPNHWATEQHDVRLIFIELNDAWSEFEETGMKPLY